MHRFFMLALVVLLASPLLAQAPEGWRVRVDERSLARVHDCASMRPAIGSRPYRRARRNLSHSSRSDHGG